MCRCSRALWEFVSLAGGGAFEGSIGEGIAGGADGGFDAIEGGEADAFGAADGDAVVGDIEGSAKSGFEGVEGDAAVTGEEASRAKCIDGNGCFTADTQVIVGVNADGTYQTKSIADVKVGDKVLTKNEYDPNGPLEEETVTDVAVHTVTSIRNVTVQLADGSTETIQTTDSHPFYVQGVGFVSAEGLIAGMVLSTPDGKTETVVGTSVTAETTGIQVYNLTVDGDHTYFVMPKASDTGTLDLDAVWVHNSYAVRTEGGFELHLELKEGWTEEQIAQAQEKVQALDQAAQRGELVRTNPDRVSGTRRIFEKERFKRL